MRMRFATFLLLAVAVGGTCSYPNTYEQAVQTALRDLGEPVKVLPRIEMGRQLLKTPWPAKINVYKVVPREFSKSALQKIFEMTGIDPRESFEGATGGVFGTPGVKYFGSLERNHTLVLIPAQGWIHFNRAEALEDKGNRNAVAPGEEVLLPRALELARILGLSEADFSKRPDTDAFDYRLGFTRQASFKSEPRVVGREIFLRRAIDGRPVVSGHLYGGLSVGLGILGMLHEFQLTARAVERDSTIAIAPLSEQLAMLIGKRNAHIVHTPAGWEESSNEEGSALEIRLVELAYFEDAPEKPQSVIPPLVRWECDLRYRGETNLVVLFSPVAQSKETAK